MALLYIDKVTTNRPAFASKVVEISNALKINPDWLMLVMHSESRLNHRAVNPNGGATGLIQFMPSTARGLGTTTTALKNMTNVQQLEYVYKYFKPYAGRIKSYYDLYLITFFPLAMGKPDNFILQTKNLSASIIAKQNPAINKWPKNDTITVGEFKQYVNSTLPKDVVNFLDDNKGTLTLLGALLIVGLFFLYK